MSLIQREIEQLKVLKRLIIKDGITIEALTGKATEETHEKQASIIDSVVDTIRTLSAKVASDNAERSSQYYNGGWIPTSELLPSDNAEVIAQFDDPDCVNDYIDFAYYDNYCHKWISRCGGLSYSVKAWMPLPRAYRED